MITDLFRSLRSFWPRREVRPAAPPSVTMRCERLEDRVVPAKYYWNPVAANDLQWSTPGNWTVGTSDGPRAQVAPGAEDSLYCVFVTSDLQATSHADISQVKDLFVTDATVYVDVDSEHSLTIGRDLKLTGGTLIGMTNLATVQVNRYAETYTSLFPETERPFHRPRLEKVMLEVGDVTHHEGTGLGVADVLIMTNSSIWNYGESSIVNIDKGNDTSSNSIYNLANATLTIFGDIELGGTISNHGKIYFMPNAGGMIIHASFTNHYRATFTSTNPFTEVTVPASTTVSFFSTFGTDEVRQFGGNSVFDIDNVRVRMDEGEPLIITDGFLTGENASVIGDVKIGDSNYPGYPTLRPGRYDYMGGYMFDDEFPSIGSIDISGSLGFTSTARLHIEVDPDGDFDVVRAASINLGSCMLVAQTSFYVNETCTTVAYAPEYGTTLSFLVGQITDDFGYIALYRTPGTWTHSGQPGRPHFWTTINHGSSYALFAECFFGISNEVPPPPPPP